MRSGSSRGAVNEGARRVRQLEAEGDVAGLIHALHSPVGRGKYGNVRAFAARALGDLGDPGAVPSLIDLVDDESEMVRMSALSALERIADPRAVPVARASLHDSAEVVRSAAARLLGALRDAGSKSVLREVGSEDPSIWVRLYALESLRKLDDPQAAALATAELSQAAWWRRQERKRLRRIVSSTTGAAAGSA